MDDLKTLIERAKSGDREALDELFLLYRDRIRGLVRRKLGLGLRRNLDSSDLVQSVCMEAMKGLDQLEYRDEKGFIHWLGRIADNTIKDKHRFFAAGKRKVDQEPGLEDPLRVSQATARDATPSRVVGQSEQMELVLQALRRLPEDYRRIITLVRFEKKSHDEAARIMGRDGKSTRMLLARARMRLLQELDRGLQEHA